MLGKGLGITDDQLRALPRFRESAAFSPLEKLVLDYASGMSGTPASVPEDLFGAQREHFDEDRIVADVSDRRGNGTDYRAASPPITRLLALSGSLRVASSNTSLLRAPAWRYQRTSWRRSANSVRAGPSVGELGRSRR